MRMLLRRAVLGFMVLAAAGCSGTSSTPASPSAVQGSTPITGVSGTSDAERAGSPVGLSGVIRDLDMTTRSFNVVLTSSTTTFARGDSRLVRADDTTQVTVKGSPARFAALASGMAISVRGTDQGRFVLAQSIVAR